MNLILRRLVNVGVLVRECMMNKAVEYRLRRAYAFPLWPGYAREVEELLPPGHVHVWADGTYSFLIHETTGPQKEVPVFAARHFFSEFVYYRALLQGVFHGFDLHSGDHAALIRAAICEAPVVALRSIVTNLASTGEAQSFLGLIGESRYCRALAGREPGSLAALGIDQLSRHTDSALELLHAVCGHDYLVRPQFRGLEQALEPRFAFLALDHALRERLLQLLQALPPSERESAVERTRRRVDDARSTVDSWVRGGRQPTFTPEISSSDFFTARLARSRMPPPSAAPPFGAHVRAEILTPLRTALPAPA